MTPIMIVALVSATVGGLIGLAVGWPSESDSRLLGARRRRLKKFGFFSLLSPPVGPSRFESVKMSRWLDGWLALEGSAATFANLRLLVTSQEEGLNRRFPSAAKYALKKLKDQKFHASLLDLIDQEEQATGSTHFSRPFEAHIRDSLNRIDSIATMYRQSWNEIEFYTSAQEKVEADNRRLFAINQGWESKPMKELPRVNESAYNELLEGEEK